jgi:hypothetical protein
MPFNPYPFPVMVIASDLIITGLLISILNQRQRMIESPLPNQIVKITYLLQIMTLVTFCLDIFPNIPLAIVM